jgi:hypothetical protein
MKFTNHSANSLLTNGGLTSLNWIAININEKSMHFPFRKHKELSCAINVRNFVQRQRRQGVLTFQWKIRKMNEFLTGAKALLIITRFLVDQQSCNFTGRWKNEWENKRCFSLTIWFKMLSWERITNENFGFQIALGSEHQTLYGFGNCKIRHWVINLFNFSWQSLPLHKIKEF